MSSFVWFFELWEVSCVTGTDENELQATKPLSGNTVFRNSCLQKTVTNSNYVFLYFWYWYRTYICIFCWLQTFSSTTTNSSSSSSSSGTLPWYVE